MMITTAIFTKLHGVSHQKTEILTTTELETLITDTNVVIIFN